MRRCEFITLVGPAALLPLSAEDGMIRHMAGSALGRRHPISVQDIGTNAFVAFGKQPDAP
jgi:hypothetical protein